MNALKTLVDLMVISVVLGTIIGLLFVPDFPRYARKAWWCVMDVAFHLAVTGVVTMLHGWELLMDRIWRVRCRLLGKRIRPTY